MMQYQCIMKSENVLPVFLVGKFDIRNGYQVSRCVIILTLIHLRTIAMFVKTLFYYISSIAQKKEKK